MLLSKPDTGIAHDHDEWRSHVELFERALDTALAHQGSWRRARQLRLHGGANGNIRIQCWLLPAPIGARVLTSVSGLISGGELLPTGLHLIADK